MALGAMATGPLPSFKNVRPMAIAPISMPAQRTRPPRVSQTNEIFSIENDFEAFMHVMTGK